MSGYNNPVRDAPAADSGPPLAETPDDVQTVAAVARSFTKRNRSRSVHGFVKPRESPFLFPLYQNRVWPYVRVASPWRAVCDFARWPFLRKGLPGRHGIRPIPVPSIFQRVLFVRHGESQKGQSVVVSDDIATSSGAGPGAETPFWTTW